MFRCIVTKGEYKGKTGYCTAVNDYGNVMFYSDEGCYPYRVCLTKDSIQIVKEVK